MKKRAHQGKRSSVSQESIHFRLCHLCFYLNESREEIHRCAKCEHDFYSVSDYLMSDAEDENADDGLEVEVVPMGALAARARSRGFRRLNGLVAIL